jgi:hypothetical protein
MVSEDSDELVPGFLPVHRLCYTSDLYEAIDRAMPAGGHELDATCELLKVLLLRAPHRMLPEERNDGLQQLQSLAYGVSVHVLPMVVVSPVRNHVSDVKELTKVVEAPDAGGTLRHRELVRNLETGYVALPARAAWLPHEADREASFSVYETDHPATKLDQPFLLIVRTRHVVTKVNAASDVTR